VLGPILRN